MAVKSCFSTRNTTTTWGTELHADSVHGVDAEAVQALRSAGGLLAAVPPVPPRSGTAGVVRNACVGGNSSDWHIA